MKDQYIIVGGRILERDELRDEFVEHINKKYNNNCVVGLEESTDGILVSVKMTKYRGN